MTAMSIMGPGRLVRRLGSAGLFSRPILSEDPDGVQPPVRKYMLMLIREDPTCVAVFLPSLLAQRVPLPQCLVANDRCDCCTGSMRRRSAMPVARPSRFRFLVEEKTTTRKPKKPRSECKPAEARGTGLSDCL